MERPLRRSDIKTMRVLYSTLRELSRRVVDLLPRGRTLPEASWRIRHRAVVVLLCGHAVAFALYAVLRPLPLGDGLTDVAVPALGAFAASRTALSRNVRSAVAATSAMLTSGVVVHLMGGSIEAHFHFFVMIPVIALYEDWIPFGLAVAVVLLHHGVMGTIDPRTVYNHTDAWQHPWRFAFLHAAFFAAACLGSIVNWRIHEQAREAEQQLTSSMRHQAHHDPLTGLPNRLQLLAQGRQVLEQSAAAGRPAAVLLIDLDRFKEVNDVLGHAAGDELLSRVGPQLAVAMRAGDVLARLGGDEFAAVLADCDEATATAVAGRVLSALDQTIDLDGVALSVDGSIGIAVAVPGEQSDIHQLLREADVAMYAAKQARCGYTVYAAEQDTSTRERLSMLGALRRAIGSDQIVLHFQPKLAVASGELRGVEALVRWNHPTLGLLPPSEFIPLAESTGMIVPLTLQVLDETFAHLQRWRAAGHRFAVAVNLSPRCLTDVDLTKHVLTGLARHGVPPNQLELEITENTLAVDPDRALATLTALFTAGIRISIDDFGTGYSSLSYLKRLPVSELKVDRSFVADMLQDAEDEVLVRSVVELGHNLGLVVVAEGVENQATLDALAAMGCDEAQGFHFARPMAAATLDRWLGSGYARVPRQRTHLHPVVGSA